jgi:hypothetical protein
MLGFEQHDHELFAVETFEERSYEFRDIVRLQERILIRQSSVANQRKTINRRVAHFAPI